MKRPPLGQHMLVDEGVLAMIIDSIAPQPEDVFVEVGPGTGCLSEALLKSGAEVYATERDGKLAAQLPERLGSLSRRLHLTVADAVVELAQPANRSWRLAGNIPYQISSPLLLNMCNCPPLQDAHVLVQLEFARRAAASAGSRVYGRLSVMLQAFHEVEVMFTVDPEAFSPPPRVDSALLRLRPRTQPPQLAASPEFSEIVRRAFGQRRKQLANALGDYARFAGDYGKMRPEQLAVDDFLNITARARQAQC